MTTTTTRTAARVYLPTLPFPIDLHKVRELRGIRRPSWAFSGWSLLTLTTGEEIALAPWESGALQQAAYEALGRFLPDGPERQPRPAARGRRARLSVELPGCRETVNVLALTGLRPLRGRFARGHHLATFDTGGELLITDPRDLAILTRALDARGFGPRAAA